MGVLTMAVLVMRHYLYDATYLLSEYWCQSVEPTRVALKLIGATTEIS